MVSSRVEKNAGLNGKKNGIHIHPCFDVQTEALPSSTIDIVKKVTQQEEA